jgi:hypothetical protein
MLHAVFTNAHSVRRDGCGLRDRSTEPILRKRAQRGAVRHPARVGPTRDTRPALKANLGLLLSDSSAGRARGKRMQALSALLPNLSAGVTQTEEQLNLQTIGFSLKIPGVSLKSLLVSKFVPGLNAVAAPMAGNSKNSYGRFALYEAAGALVWSGAYLAAGYMFSDQLERVLGYASRLKTNLFLVGASLFGIWIGWKYFQRRRFIGRLRTDRITPEELQLKLTAGEDLLIVDLRTGLPDALHSSQELFGSRRKIWLLALRTFLETGKSCCFALDPTMLPAPVRRCY